MPFLIHMTKVNLNPGLSTYSRPLAFKDLTLEVSTNHHQSTPINLLFLGGHELNHIYFFQWGWRSHLAS